MATERRRQLRWLAPMLVAVTATLLPAGADAAGSWWEQLAFAGQRVDAVVVAQGALSVHLAGGWQTSRDGGRHFTAAARAPVASVASAGAWQIRSGVVEEVQSRGTPRPDPGAPYLGPAAHLVAAPAALPGVVVAVGSDGHVWRRGQDGRWATALILLPQGGLTGPPAVTGLAAFSTPITGAIYLASDGYGVLLSQDGGDDWIRAEAGLPQAVLGLAADPGARSLFAATDRGLYVHHLQALPAPPVYRDSALLARRLGVAAVALVALVLALWALLCISPGTEASASGPPRPSP